MGEGDERGLVCEVIFTVVHGAQTERTAVAGDAGAGDEFDGRVFQDFGFGAGDLDAGIGLAEGADFGRIGIVDEGEFAASLAEAVAHAVDVTVVEADGGEGEISGLADAVGLAGGGVIHAVGFLHGRM